MLWAPAAVLDDDGKAAADRRVHPAVGQGLVWAYENPDAWNEEFYVKTQN